MDEEVELWNEVRYVMWELIQGKIDAKHSLYKWVTDRGIRGEDLDWYRKYTIEPDIIGINYYPQFSVNAITKEAMEKEQISEAVPGTAKELIEIAVDIYHRYKKSIFITETSYCETVEERIA